MGKQGVIPSLCRNCKVRKPHVALIEAFEQGRVKYDLTPYHHLCLNIFSGGFLYSKLKNKLSPYGLLIAGLTAVTLITALAGVWHYNNEVAAQITKNSPKAAASITASSQSQASSASSNSSDPSTKKSSATSNPESQSAESATQNSVNRSESNVSVQQSSVRLSLSINGYLKGVVSLPVGSNQCDLLTKALADHLISSLDMRYSSQYKTQGIYVIDGIGDPGSVWWTYKVNGKSPPYGCAMMPARDGDSVNWQYVKS